MRRALCRPWWRCLLEQRPLRALLARGGGLASGEWRARKVGARDLAPAVAARANGGTTVSATCAVAGRPRAPRLLHRRHRRGAPRGGGDVSEDLHALSRFPGMVVCTGAKSVLDLPRTLEALESLGVLVVGYRTGEFPAFYEGSSGLLLSAPGGGRRRGGSAAPSPPRPAGAARRRCCLCVPPPEGTALAHREELTAALLRARAEAETQRVSGQALTPFLLQALAVATGGRTVRANLALLEENARVAAEVAVAYERLR